jgi:hypothetical protein
MRVLTVSDTDDSGLDEGEPLLVARVDGPMIRRVLALVVDQLAAPTEARPVPRHVVPMRAASPPAPASDSDRNEP